MKRTRETDKWEIKYASWENTREGKTNGNRKCVCNVGKDYR